MNPLQAPSCHRHEFLKTSQIIQDEGRYGSLQQRPAVIFTTGDESRLKWRVDADTEVGTADDAILGGMYI